MSWGALAGSIIDAAGDWKNWMFDQELAGDQREWMDARAEEDWAMQERFYRNSLPWMVQSAKESGIHPLAALGFRGTAGTPTHVGGGQRARANFGRHGQSIGRAIDKLLSSDEKRMKKNFDMLELKKSRSELEQMNLQNELMRDEINKSQNQGSVIQREAEQTIKGQAGTEVGDRARDMFVETPTGLKRMITRDVSEPLESDAFDALHMFIEKGWVFANQLFSPETAWVVRDVEVGKPKKDKYPLPQGWEYRYNPVKREYQAKKIGDEGSQTFVQKYLWPENRWPLFKIDIRRTNRPKVIRRKINRDHPLYR